MHPNIPDSKIHVGGFKLSIASLAWYTFGSNAPILFLKMQLSISNVMFHVGRQFADGKQGLQQHAWHTPLHEKQQHFVKPKQNLPII